MNSNKKLLWVALTGASFMFTGCSNEKDLTIDNLTVVEEGSVKPAQKAESAQPTAILGKGGSMSGQLLNTFTNIVEPNKAKHVIVACSDLDAYEEELVAAYKRGIVITVVDPVGSELEAWCAARGMVYSGDPLAIDRSSLISFNRKAVSMSVQKKMYKGDIIEEDEVPLVIFTGWLETILTPNLKGPDFRSRDIMKRFAPQRVGHVFPIDIPLEVVKETGWGIPENATLHAAAELSCDIYPMHSFADNASFTGDLYAVEAELTIHNGNLYNGRWQYSQGGKLYESSGFYLSECSLGVSLHERTASGLVQSGSHVFAGGPSPVSLAQSSQLQTGFEWSFDGWLTGGNGLESATPTPIQEGGWTWNNMKETAAAGFDIEATAEGGDALWTLVFPESQDNAGSATASGDLTFRCSWIWGVPNATDDSIGRYYMQVNLNPVYRWIRSVVSGSRIESTNLSSEVPSACFMLIPPSRVEGQRI
ncbi:MAG: hypothetical protein K2J58_01980 [Muribaculaceae bacterium]|nr:hypothetical protein [Muribaculaceae bacterium]